ncbi:MAG: hypothetical protein V4722_27225 [Bacteroidota bacterium]
MKKNALVFFLSLSAAITQAQNVGIGTNIPGTKLTVVTPVFNFGMEHSVVGGVSIKSYVNTDIGQIGTFSNHPFDVMANNGLAQLRVMPNGFVGINSVNPTFQLDVNGTLRTTGKATFGTDVQINGGTPANKKVLTASDNLGNASWVYPPAYNTGFRVYTTGSTAVTIGNTGTILFNNTAFGNGHFDDGAAFDNTINSYVAPANGVYQFNVSVGIANGNAVQAGEITVSTNGTGFLASNLPGTTVMFKAGDPYPETLGFSFLTKMDAGSSIKIQIYQTVGGTVTAGVSLTQFSGVRVY